jgi:hypothetical protein
MSYTSLSTAEKRRYHLDRMREPPLRCPICDAAVQADDLLAHARERCAGKLDPHPRSEWATWAEALACGVSGSLLHYWVAQGHVRVTGDDGARRYLLRDIVVLVVARDFKKSKRGRNRLTNIPRNHHAIGMGNHQIDESMRGRLRGLADHLGGIEALARKMDIPARTLRSAIRGGSIRQGTMVLIEWRLDRILT